MFFSWSIAIQSININEYYGFFGRLMERKKHTDIMRMFCDRKNIDAQYNHTNTNQFMIRIR